MIFTAKKMLKKFLSYYRPHRLMFTLDMLAALVVAAVGIFYPIVTRVMLNELIPEKVSFKQRVMDKVKKNDAERKA